MVGGDRRGQGGVGHTRRDAEGDTAKETTSDQAGREGGCPCEEAVGQSGAVQAKELSEPGEEPRRLSARVRSKDEGDKGDKGGDEGDEEDKGGDEGGRCAGRLVCAGRGAREGSE